MDAQPLPPRPPAEDASVPQLASVRIEHIRFQRTNHGRHVFYSHCVRLQGDGPEPAVAALEEFVNGSWLQSLDGSWIDAMLQMQSDEGVNLREEGQALRSGAWVKIWLSYASEAPQLQLPWTAYCELLQTNRLYLQIRAYYENQGEPEYSHQSGFRVRLHAPAVLAQKR